MGEKIKWVPPEYYVCPHCGSSNPDNGDKCGNCEKNPFKLPDKNEQLTETEYKTLKEITQRPKRRKPAA